MVGVKQSFVNYIVYSSWLVGLLIDCVTVQSIYVLIIIINQYMNVVITFKKGASMKTIETSLNPPLCLCVCMCVCVCVCMHVCVCVCMRVYI